MIVAIAIGPNPGSIACLLLRVQSGQQPRRIPRRGRLMEFFNFYQIEEKQPLILINLPSLAACREIALKRRSFRFGSESPLDVRRRYCCATFRLIATAVHSVVYSQRSGSSKFECCQSLSQSEFECGQ